MEPYKINDNDVFVSTRLGSAISLIEGATIGAAVFYATILLTFPGQEPRSSLPLAIPVLFIIIGSLTGILLASNIKKSIVAWRFFLPHDALVLREYRKKERVRLSKEIEENAEMIEQLEKKNLEMKRILIDLS